MKSRVHALSSTPTWLVTIGIVIAAGAYVLLVFLPFQRSIASLRQQLHNQQRQVVEADQLLLPLAAEGERLADVRAHNESWQRQAPGPQELAAFYSRLSEQAHRANVPLLKFEPQPSRSLQTVQQHGVALSIQGDFEQIFDFLARVEHFPQTVWPTHFRLAQPEVGSASLQCEMTLTIFGDHTGSSD